MVRIGLDQKGPEEFAPEELTIRHRTGTASWSAPGASKSCSVELSRSDRAAITVPICQRHLGRGLKHLLKAIDTKRELPNPNFVVYLRITGVLLLSALGAGMAHYRAYLLDQHRHVISVANLQCADEQDARERARQLVDVNDIELWQLDRRIAVFKAAISRTSQAAGTPQRTQRPTDK